MWNCLHIKHPFFLSHLNETWIFFEDFRKTKIPNFTNVRLEWAELFNADWRTEELDEAFASHFFKRAWNRVKIQRISSQYSLSSDCRYLYRLKKLLYCRPKCLPLVYTLLHSTDHTTGHHATNKNASKLDIGSYCGNQLTKTLPKYDGNPLGSYVPHFVINLPMFWEFIHPIRWGLRFCFQERIKILVLHIHHEWSIDCISENELRWL